MCIQDNLEKEERNDSIIQVVREKDVLCGKGARLCGSYLDHTLEFKCMFLPAKNMKERKEVMSTIYMTLSKEEGFHFLEVTGEQGWKEKTYDSGIMYVKRRMMHVCREKDDMTQSMKALEAAPGPFETSESLPRNGIVNCQVDVPEGHHPNTMFRRVIRATAACNGKI